MYDELVKRLRQLAEEQMFDFERQPYLQAADAIEELSKLHETQKKNLSVLTDAYMKRWISVEERLPEKTNHYLVRVKCGCDGKLVSAWEQVAWFCGKFYWEHLHGSDVFEETVTHWMPLPQAPKEET